MDNSRRSLPVGRVLGIDILVHYSWVFIAGLILFGFWGQLDALHPSLDSSTTLALAALGTGLFFGSILLHESAHAVVARRRGLQVRAITLYLFGGATEAEASSRTPTDEFVVAIVGPITSLAAAAVFAAAASIAEAASPLRDVLAYLAAANIVLAVFNLMPGLPLDGGRVFRSAVWGLTGDFTKATRWATVAGVTVGYVLVGLGFLSLWAGTLGGLWLVAIGWVISQSARQTEYQESLESEFAGLVAADIMTSPVITIPAQTSIADSVRDYFSRRMQTAFPVVEGSDVVGLLSVQAVRKIPATDIWKTTAGQVASWEAPPLIVGRATPMRDVIAGLAGGPDGRPRALVLEDGLVLGIISPSDIIRRHSIADLIGPALADRGAHPGPAHGRPAS